MDNPVLTPEKLKAAQEAAREKLLRKQAQATRPAQGPAPAAPPRPPTLKERMAGKGLVPIDELLALAPEIDTATAAEEGEIEARFKQGQRVFDELCELQGKFAESLGRRGREVADSARALLEDQVQRRVVAVAEAVNETRRRVETASRLGAVANGGVHFGDLSRVLEAAVRDGFYEVLSDERFAQEPHRAKRRVISNRGRHYAPADFQESVLSRFVSFRIRELFVRAIKAADAERAVQFAILESGPFPTPYELLELLAPEKPLAGQRQFGCVLVGLSVPRRDGKGVAHANGIIQLGWMDVAGVGKSLCVLAANGSIEHAVPEPVTIPLASMSGSPAIAAIAAHLSGIATDAVLTDEQAAQLNAVRARKKDATLVPETVEERQFRFLELRGDLWRIRNSRWIARHTGAAQAAAEQPATEAGTSTAPAEPRSAAKSRKRKPGSAKAKGGNGVPEGAAAAPAPSGDASDDSETPTS